MAWPPQRVFVRYRVVARAEGEAKASGRGAAPLEARARAVGPQVGDARKPAEAAAAAADGNGAAGDGKVGRRPHLRTGREEEEEARTRTPQSPPAEVCANCARASLSLGRPRRSKTFLPSLALARCRGRRRPARCRGRPSSRADRRRRARWPSPRRPPPSAPPDI